MTEAKSAADSRLRRVLWHSSVLPSTERAVFTGDAAGHRIEGTVLTMLNDLPVEIRYGVVCAPDWSTRSCSIRIDDAGTGQTFEIAAAGNGRWMVDGRLAPELDGLHDIDLGFTPATNTLPLRRMPWRIGETRRITVAWFRYPELDVVPAEQLYTRLADRQYRFETGDGSFTATIAVDEMGVVTDYEGLWVSWFSV